MSIVVNIYYTGTDGNARKFAEEMESSGTAAAVRREAGNLRYDYFFPMTEPETVLLIDCWKDQQALDQHHASPMMEKIAEKILRLWILIWKLMKCGKSNSLKLVKACLVGGKVLK